MTVSVRSCLTAGISVVAAGLIAIPPSVPPQTPPVMQASRGAKVAPQIELAASVRPLVVETPSPQKFAAAVAVIEKIDPTAREAALQAVTPAVAPVPLNAASDLIVSGYQFIQYWVDYGVQLTNYVLNFVPYGYLIAGQVNIFYYNLIRPISDSVVYDLIVPVVNDPLNPASYVNGLVNVGQTAINATINTAIAELNYFFGWLIPPLPLAAVAKSVPTVEEAPTTLAASLEPATQAADPTAPIAEQHTVFVPEPTAVPAVEKSTSTPIVTATDVETKVENTTVEETPETTTPETTTPETTTSANGIEAQGKVRGGTDVKDDPTAVMTKDTGPKASELKGRETPETKAPETKTAETTKDPTSDGEKTDG